MSINVLFFGDIVGRVGRRAFANQLPSLKEKHKPDLIIVNGENSAKGKGITTKIYKEYLKLGVHCITSGNHIFDNREILKNKSMEELTNLIRPSNYPYGVPGNTIFNTEIKGTSVAIVNLLGQVFMPPTDSPFLTMSRLLDNELKNYPIIIVDLHAEATSEKIAFAKHFSGEISAVIGTHTHVQTADAQVINHYTGYITDVGMVGAKDSILGMATDTIITKFLTQMPVRMEPPEGDSLEVVMSYASLEINNDGSTSKMESFRKIV